MAAATPLSYLVRPWAWQPGSLERRTLRPHFPQPLAKQAGEFFNTLGLL